MEYKELDTVLLKDGREGTIVAVLGKDLFSVDVGETPETWDNVSVPRADIVKVISCS